MPEMTFDVRWPDGAVDRCYSPSLVIHDHLNAQTTYTVADFVTRATTALDIASERVRAKYGFACTSAMATLDLIRSRATRFTASDEVVVGVLDPPADASANIVGSASIRPDGTPPHIDLPNRAGSR